MNTRGPFWLWFCPTTSNGPFYFSESPLLIFPSNKCHQFSGRYYQFRVEPANSVLPVPSETSGFDAAIPLSSSLWPFPTTIKSLSLKYSLRQPSLFLSSGRHWFNTITPLPLASEPLLLTKVASLLRLCTKRRTSTVQLDEAAGQNNTLCFPRWTFKLVC